MKEKEQWARVAADSYKTAMKCSGDEATGVRIGWLFGFDATKGRLDKKLSFLQKMLFEKDQFSACDLVKDIRESIQNYGETDK